MGRSGSVIEALFDYAPWVFAAFGVPLAALLLARSQRIRRERLGRLAARRNGRLAAGPWFMPPRALWELPGALLQVAVRGDRPESGPSGVRSFAHTACADYPEIEFALRHASGLHGEHDDWHEPDTRDPLFDRAFRVRCEDPRFARTFLDRELRQALLAFPADLRVALQLGQSSVYRDGLYQHGHKEQRLELSLRGFPEDVQGLEQLVQLARQVHERLRGLQLRQAA